MVRVCTLLLLVALLLTACNREDNRQLSNEEIAQMAEEHIDSLLIVADSLPGVVEVPPTAISISRKPQIELAVHLPPLYDKNVFDSATTVKFLSMALASKGELKLLVNSKLLTQEIVSIINNHATDNTDVLILMDKTMSMWDDIDNVKQGMGQVIAAMKQHDNIRLAVSLYADKNYNGDDWFSFKNFETDLDTANAYIQSVRLISNLDIPESVYDAFFKCMDQDFWKPGNRHVVILIGDAPPQEIPLSNYSISDVITEASRSGINMNFYPIIVTPETVTSKVGLKEYVAGNLISSLYPNPSHGVVNVALAQSGTYQLELFNINGELMLTEEYAGGQWQRDLSAYANGTYVLRISNENKEYETRKFILQK